MGVTLFLALLELYKSGGIYVDLTTLFIRPLPAGVDGFVVGGEYGAAVLEAKGPEPGEGDTESRGDCSLPTAVQKRQRAFVMQVVVIKKTKSRRSFVEPFVGTFV